MASCGSNGKLYKLVINQSELSLANTYQLHERTINKINFHPNDPNLLISGGGDGLIKLVDFRCSPLDPSLTFKHETESRVTDVQFCPLPYKTKQFASGSENGHTFVI